MIGQTLGHYRIVEKIGAGGMGEVYRARDEHLGRDVAIKVLPTGTLADEAARKRFRKEALALSKLNHPNIATVHDFDTQDGVDFLVMEHVGGTTLAEKLKSGSLPEKEVAQWGSQLASALEEAHEQHVVHRDLKPGNIALTVKGQVKVLDFGLAKLVRPVAEAITADSLSETQAGAGTLPYMAPEQLRGEKADARSDLYATGAVLYEMATGQRPFPETHGPRLTDAILHQAPPSPGRLKPQLSPRLEEIILKCLEKDPEHRYQSARDLLVDFRRLGAPAPAVPGQRKAMRWWPVAAAGAVVVLLAVLLGLNVGGLRQRLFGGVEPGQITSIAVLPLDNLMGDTEQEYFVEGMHEALITDLSRIGALKVISRTSVMRYKDTDKPIPEIARELGVDAVVEGSVLRVGNQVRITAQLIHAATDEHLWAEAYERDLTNILALQREVAQAIAREIKIAVTPEEQARLASARPVNSEAHEAYLKGRYQWNKRSEEGLSQAIQFFQQAIEKDPAYARAYAGLADVYVVQPWWGFARASEAFPRARALALKALELDENLAEPYATLGSIKYDYDRDWSAAEQDFNRALELNPNYATAHFWYGMFLSMLGKHEEAIGELESAERLDPLAPIISTNLGRVLYYARRYDQAAQQFRKTVEMHPEFYMAFVELGKAYAQKGMYPEALAAVGKGSGLPEVDPNYGYVGWIYARSGRKAEAQRLLRRLRELSSQQYIDPGAIAVIYIGLGQNEQALTWLERGYEHRGPFLILFLKVDPVFDPLRDDPRFQALLRRMNFPE